MKSETHDQLNFKDRQDWRAWLKQNHSKCAEAWLIIQKAKSMDTGLHLAAAVEEALCFGWIDSKLIPRDETSYLLRFSPRAADSVWSVRNIQRVDRLTEQGAMQSAGLQAVQAGKESGQWQAALEREDTDFIPADLKAALERQEGALAAYHALNDSTKKRYLYWLQSAKRDSTRAKRIVEIRNLLQQD